MKRQLMTAMALMAAWAAFGETYDPAKHGNPIVVTSGTVEIDGLVGGQKTVIDAKGLARCATLGPNVTIRNFVLKNGKAEIGGGVYGGKVVDCKISGCQATESAAAICNSVAENCTITGNAFANGSSTAAAHGGILFGSTLKGCTVSGNTVKFGSEAPAFGGIGERVVLIDCEVGDNTVSAGELVCYGRLYADSKVEGESEEFEDGEEPTPPGPTPPGPTPPDPPEPPTPTPPDPPGPFDPWIAFENIYFKASLADLGATAVPTNRKITIKAEGLPKGLKLVTTALKDERNRATGFYAYAVEGVPTELMDGKSRRAYVRVTDNRVQTLYALDLKVRSALEYEQRSFPDGTNRTIYANFSAQWLWDVAANPKNWTFSGWPSGIKYATKDTKDAKACEVYGTPTKAGRFTVKAVEKIAGTSYKSTHVATFTVWPEALESEAEWTDPAYEGVYRESEADVTAASGLPTGIKFTARDIVSRGEVTTEAHHFYGTPTKAGTYAVTLTHEDKSKTGFFWTITPAAAPTFGLKLTEAEVDPMTAKATVRAGVSYDWAIGCASNATVTASGLPTGLKLVKTAVKSGTKTVGYTYSVAGVPTKAGEFFTTFTTKLNGVSTVTTAAFTVLDLPPWAQGTFDGGVGASEISPGGQVTLTVSKTGKLSGKWLSLGTNWTLTATSYARYDRENDCYYAKVVRKTGSGKKTISFTEELRVSPTSTTLGGLAGSDLFAAYQNNWKLDPWKTAGKSFSRAREFVFVPDGYETNDTISLKFAASGKVTVKGKFVKSVSDKGRITWHSASGSAVLCPQTELGEDNAFGAYVFVYLPPKAKTPLSEGGYAVCVPVVWDGTEFDAWERDDE